LTASRSPSTRTQTSLLQIRGMPCQIGDQHPHSRAFERSLAEGALLALHPVLQQRRLLRIAAPVPSRLLVTSRPARCIRPASGGACSRVCGIRSCRTTPHRPAVARRLTHFSVSFTGVHRRPPPSVREHRRRSRTVANLSEHISAVLESVLGASPQEFESLILRQLSPARTSGPGHSSGWPFAEPVSVGRCIRPE
jgi:hypothetical protein